MKTEKTMWKKIFSSEEKADLAAKMADSFAEHDALTDEFDAVRKDYKMRIDRALLTAKICGEKHRTGYEMIPVEAEKTINYELKIVQLKHPVTGEIISTRDATEKDLQMEFEDLS